MKHKDKHRQQQARETPATAEASTPADLTASPAFVEFETTSGGVAFILPEAVTAVISSVPHPGLEFHDATTLIFFAGCNSEGIRVFGEAYEILHELGLEPPTPQKTIRSEAARISPPPDNLE